MLKLLLKPDRMEVKKEYFFRFLNLFLVFAIVAVLATGALMAAPYIFVELQERVVEDQIEILRSSDDSIQKAELDNASKELKKDFDILQRPTPHYSDFISLITNVAPAGISLNAWTFKYSEADKDRGQQIEIEIRGHATRREVLVGFVNSLKADDELKEVDLPLSNLARESDINFVLTIWTENLKIENYEN